MTRASDLARDHCALAPALDVMNQVSVALRGGQYTSETFVFEGREEKGSICHERSFALARPPGLDDAPAFWQSAPHCGHHAAQPTLLRPARVGSRPRAVATLA